MWAAAALCRPAAAGPSSTPAAVAEAVFWPPLEEDLIIISSFRRLVTEASVARELCCHRPTPLWQMQTCCPLLESSWLWTSTAAVSTTKTTPAASHRCRCPLPRLLPIHLLR